jgi:flagellar basal body-associated protein FliL
MGSTDWSPTVQNVMRAKARSRRKSMLRALLIAFILVMFICGIGAGIAFMVVR